MIAWQVCLQTRLQCANRIAVIGISNSLSGDDRAGRVLIDLLREHLPFAEDVLLLDLDTDLENFNPALRQFRPDLVILVSTLCSGDTDPGHIQVLEQEYVDKICFSERELPLSLFGRHLRSEIGCETIIIGIQPGPPGIQTLSAPLSRAVEQLAGTLSSLLHGFFTIPL